MKRSVLQARANQSKAREHQLKARTLLPKAREHQLKVNALQARASAPLVKAKVLRPKARTPLSRARECQLKVNVDLLRGRQRKGNVHQGHLKHHLIQKLQMGKRSTLKQAQLPGRVIRKNKTLLKQPTSRL
jgi:hypothetical protein